MLARESAAWPAASPADLGLDAAGLARTARQLAERRDLQKVFE